MKMPLPRNLLKSCLALALVTGTGLHAETAGGPVDVLPVHVSEGALSLAGTWQFKYIASSAIGADENFFQPSTDVAAWKIIPVPSHWELHGFAEPKYKKVDEGTGLYRRTFRVPAAWRGQRVMLRFDGVLYGFTLWVNGKPIGEWASSYNPATFDITDALLPGEADNVLAVRVTTRSKGWEFDTNDCWALSGIYRDVTLFTVPATHLKDYTARTTLKPDGSAELSLEVVASAEADVVGHLTSPDGQTVQRFQLKLPAEGRAAASVAIPRPQLWTAETPSLYRLDLELQSGGKPVQRFSSRVGLREVTIDHGVMLLNGRPIKLRGVNHHDIWPDEGRVVTEELLRRDLDLIRRANINFIRTSHYPPHPRLIELCDELGIYVMCEVPFGFGDKNLTDPTFEPVLRARARATVMRDKNRPSVIIWSIGNENPITDLGTKTALYTKELDPSRPVCFPTVGSYFRNNLEKFLTLPAAIDVFSPHYGSAERLREYATTLQRPIIATEYAHALGLAFDSFQDIWEVIYQQPRIAGGAVWMFQDQGIRRDARVTGKPEKGAYYVWPDATHYYDTAGTDGCDGIVYSDRTPQADYWQVRKVYSPVRITERRIEVAPGTREIRLEVENRYDFRKLSGIKLAWSLRRNGATLQSGEVPLSAAPRAKETVAIPATLPSQMAQGVCTLELTALNEHGEAIVERAIRLEVPGESAAATLLAALPAGDRPTVSRTQDSVAIAQGSFSVVVQLGSGEIEIRRRSGELLASGFRPHTSRRFTMAEDLRVSRPSSQAAAELELRTGASSIWRDAMLRPAGPVDVDVTESTNGARLTVRGRYARAEDPAQGLTGEVVLDVTQSGKIEVSYAFTPVNAKGQLLEAGLGMLVPAAATEFRWLGAGPFAGYPGKDALNELGVHHLARGDLRFRGNRREVEVALLTRGTGEGVLVAGKDMDVAVEDEDGLTMLSHNALVSGLGNKGGAPESRLEIATIKVIAGRFTLVPLESDWPRLVTEWFGQPNRTVEVMRPFLRSYDQ